MNHWQFEPQQLAPIAVLAFAYWWRARALAARARPVSPYRLAAFACGVATLVLALVSPLDWYGENRVLWSHMIQHLLLGDIAPLLVVLSLTGALLRPLLARRWVRRLRGLGHPLVALPLWTVDLYVWHLPFLYQAALRNSTVHALEHFFFFTCGALMWAAVIEPLPGPVWFGNGPKALYTLVVRTAGAILANVFIWDSHPIYGYYAAVQHGTGISTVADQRAAGAIMFIEGSIVTLLAFAWLFIRFTRELEVRQRLVERSVEAPAAARAARYGRAARTRDVLR